MNLGFDELPAEHRARAHGVDYARFMLESGGELLVTRFGWAMNDLVIPEAWYVNSRYSKNGVRLTGSTGTVYRVPVVPPLGGTESIVVKFSRVAQDVPLFIDASVAGITPRDIADTAFFNDPYEEFGILMQLRQGPFSRTRPRIRTKLPLAIYSPPDRYEDWQLGRKSWLFHQHQDRLAADQANERALKPLTLDFKRDYILLFQWVKGRDAHDMHVDGILSAEDMTALFHRSMRELAANGLIMLDNKPRHLVLRQDKDGRLMRRNGELVYTLIDFELMQPFAQWAHLVHGL